MIRRIRIGFLILAAVLLVPLGWLLSRTVQGIAHERDLRHNAVASRVFDESERLLSEFLREEESRPAAHYRPVLATGAPSPLARAPRRGFVVGYFQLGPEGDLRSPRSDASPAFLAELRSILPAPTRAAEADALFDRDRAPAEPQERGKAEAAGAASRAQSARQTPPGTTRVLQKVDVIGRVALEEEAVAPQAVPEAKEESLSPYGVLGRLNRASRERRDAREQADRYALAPSRDMGLAPAADDVEFFALGVPSERAGNELESTLPGESGRAGPQQGAALEAPPPAGSAGEARLDAPPQTSFRQRVAASTALPAAIPPAIPSSPAGAPPAAGPVRRLELGPSPLSGAAIGPGRIVLYRTAVLPGADGPVRQGLLVDGARLSDWLRGEVLGKGGLLGSLALDFRTQDAPWSAAPRGEDFVYEHRFGEPFQTLSARLHLPPLPDEGGARNVYWMGVLLVVASTLGLFAVYRRVATAVHFAERRSNFAAAVSHELKTPLTSIRMYAEMLRDGMVDSEAKRREYYATITSESERLTRLINNVLEFSKLEHQRRERSAIVGPIEPALRDVIRVVEPHALAQGLALKLQVDPDLPPARHDPDALQQILFNAIDNALKYARDAEPPEIEVRAQQVEGDVRVYVRDHGPGVAPEHLPHVFEAFYRGESELTRRARGTGIGLALVRGLAEEMGATVSARNHPRGGLEFELRLRR